MSKIINNWIDELQSLSKANDDEEILSLLKVVRKEVVVNQEIHNLPELESLAEEISKNFDFESQDVYQLALQAFCNLITASSNLKQPILENIFLSQKTISTICNKFLTNPMVSTVTLVLTLNLVKDSKERCQRFYKNAQGIKHIDFLTECHLKLSDDQATLLESIIEELLNNGLLQYTFDDLHCSEKFPLLSDFQFKILEAASASQNTQKFIPAQLIMLDQFEKLVIHIQNSLDQISQSETQAKILHHNISIWLQFYFHQTQDDQLFRNTLVSGNIVAVLVQLLDFCHKSFPTIARLSEVDTSTQKLDYSQFPDIKKNVIQILNNLMEGDRNIPNQIRELGAIPALLSCCNIDDNNPYIREHAIFAIKNLTHENIKNQEFIEKLTPIKAAPNPVLKELGLESSLDSEGKLEIKKSA